MEMYKKYIKERENSDLVEVAHGFATYRHIEADTVYLVDIFVEEEYRQDGIGKTLSHEVAKIAKELGATKLAGSICLGANGVTLLMAALIGDGFKFTHANGNMLYFIKDI